MLTTSTLTGSTRLAQTFEVCDLGSRMTTPTPTSLTTSMGARPKRKYTVTPKVLAACRANLLKANAVPKAIRYRSTEKRLRACRANLLKAIRARKADRSRTYASNFRLGLYPISLRRSLAAAGESEAEYDAHLARFLDAFDPQDKVEQKLVRALAKVWWRHLRALRLWGRSERRRLDVQLLNAQRELSPDETAAQRDRDLAGNLMIPFLHYPALFPKLERLSMRMERLGRVLLNWREGGDCGVMFAARHNACESRMPRWPEPCLSNPFVGTERVRRALKNGEPRIRGIRGWSWQPSSQDDDFDEDDEVPRAAAVSHPQAPLADFAAHLQRVKTAFRESQDPSPEVRRVAVLTWARARIFGVMADNQAEHLKGHLEVAARDAQELKAKGLKPRWSRCLARLMGTRYVDSTLLESVNLLHESLMAAFYDLLTKRHRKRKRFEIFHVENYDHLWDNHADQFLAAVDQAEKAASSG